jgi:hypothetical protein
MAVPPHHAHESARVSASILRLSALQRLGGVALVLALLWGSILWTIAS